MIKHNKYTERLTVLLEQTITAAATARANLISSKGWTITDQGGI